MKTGASLAPTSAERGECAMGSLVEARRDGRLGEREAASLERHLLTCAACRDLERTLDEVRTLLRKPARVSPTPLEHQRGRLALLRAAAAPASPPKPRPARLPALVALAGAALVASSAFAVVRTHTHEAVSGVPIVQHLPAPALPAAVAKGERTETILRGSTEARYDRRVDGDVERVTLSEGTLHLEVRKLAPTERFLVVTDDAEVEVRGTVFQVEAHAHRIARVEVTEGKVEVRYRRGISIVAAGGAWQPPADGGLVAANDPPAAHRGGERPRARASAPVTRTPKPTASTPVRDDASKAFDEAVDTLGRGDYAEARSRLEAFREAHPKDARADLAAFLTIVSLERAGHHAEAREAARRYLALYPDGDRRNEAMRVAEGR